MVTRAVLAAVLLVVGCGGDGRAVEPADESPWSRHSRGWSRLPTPPFLRARAAMVWTGEEVLVWGGETAYGDVQHADGLAYDTFGQKWRELPPSPLPPRSSAAAVWTGKEMLIWGGWSSGARTLADGAAYDPKTRSWRLLPAAPLSARVPVAAVWTGRELLLWGDTSRSQVASDGAAYDPEADRWRALPPAPVALNEASGTWTGTELIIFGALLDGNNWSNEKHARGVAYNPSTDRWRQLGPHALSPQASWAIWTGDEVLVWDYELEAAAYHPQSDSWRDLRDLPLEFSECYPLSVRVGRHVFAWHCGGPAALFELRSQQWRVVPLPSPTVAGRPLPASDAVVFVEGSSEGRESGWIYRP